MISELDHSIRREINRLARKRGAGKTFCPSVVVDRLNLTGEDAMDHVRRVAATMADEGLIEVTQGGKPVDLDRVSGPIRLGRRDRDSSTPRG